jgi:hypothetical protein
MLIGDAHANTVTASKPQAVALLAQTVSACFGFRRDSGGCRGSRGRQSRRAAVAAVRRRCACRRR